MTETRYIKEEGFTDLPADDVGEKQVEAVESLSSLVEKPVVIIAERNDVLRTKYEEAVKPLAALVDFYCVSGSIQHQVPTPSRARLLITDYANRALANIVFQNIPPNSYHGVVLATDDKELLKSNHSEFGVNEVWETPLRFPWKPNELIVLDTANTLDTVNTLKALVEKYTANVARVLVVDDEQHVRNLVKAALKKDYTVFTAENAESALQYVPSVHLVISDVNQPGIGGYGLLEIVRAHYTEDQLPFVLMSGDKFDDDKSRGAQVRVSKPFSISKIREIDYKLIPEHLKPKK